MNTESYFIDSNLLVYLISGDTRKAELAEKLILGGATFSVQVLNEFTAVARRKYKREFAEIEEILDLAKTHAREVIPVTLEMHERALEIAMFSSIGIYDACIVAAAQFSNCTVLFTEDLNDGEHIGSVTIRNPFRAA
jgi:predicted nucleic acid-binding protein